MSKYIFLPLLFSFLLVSCGETNSKLAPDVHTGSHVVQKEVVSNQTGTTQTGGMDNSFSQTGAIACTMEAKMCPDGKTFVGRTGPKCEFETCPADNSGSSDLAGSGKLSTTGKEKEGYEWRIVTKSNGINYDIKALYSKNKLSVDLSGNEYSDTEHGKIYIRYKDDEMIDCKSPIPPDLGEHCKNLEDDWNYSLSQKKSLFPKQTTSPILSLGSGKYIELYHSPEYDEIRSLGITYTKYTNSGYAMVYGSSFSEDHPIINRVFPSSKPKDYYDTLAKEFELGKFSNPKMNEWYQNSLYQIDHLDETIKKLDLKPR